MSGQQFDELTKDLAARTASRRTFLGVAAASIGTLLAPRGARALDAPGGSTCSSSGQSCTTQQCCGGYTCLTDETSGTDKFCCPDNLVCGSRCCPTGAFCTTGQRCLCPVEAPTTCKSTTTPLLEAVGECVNTATDLRHCGGCNVLCSPPANATAVCSSGTCTFVCNAPFADCDLNAANGCETNLQTDEANCGVCGNRCATGATCTTGACVCPLGEIVCGATATDPGTCVDLQTSLTNCGDCGHACPNRANASKSCAAGTCVYTCNADFASCDTVAPTTSEADTTGCETNLQTDEEHCGTCATDCTALPNVATVHCASGVCVIDTCVGTFANCDNDVTNGCETNTATDVNNCGGCNNQCTTNVANAHPTCIAGTCGFACDTGFKVCNGACIPVTGCCTNAECADLNPCTTDICDQTTHTCVHTTIAGCCQTAADCPTPTNQCRQATCVSNACVETNKPNGAACNDSNVCTANDVCTNGVCAGTPVAGCCQTASDCPTPTNQCKQAACVSNACVETNKPNGTACNDSNVCTANDVCTNGVCGGTAVTCSGAQVCCTSGMHAGTCKLPSNATCGANGQCCSNNCLSGTPRRCA